MLDKEKAREIATRYAEEVRKELAPKAVILFGSHVNGTAHEHSDIDIAVVVNDFTGDWLKTSALLSSLTRKVNIAIEPHMMDETSDKSGFLDHIMKTGEVIYHQR